MSDLISRQAVLDDLEKSHMTSGVRNQGTWNECIDSMMRTVRSMPPVNPQEPKWIPVSERLPEKNMACLVAVGRYNLTQMAIYSNLMGTIDHRIFYQGDMGYDNFEDITEYVKAWMPLPKPYEPQEVRKHEERDI